MTAQTFNQTAACAKRAGFAHVCVAAGLSYSWSPLAMPSLAKSPCLPLRDRLDQDERDIAITHPRISESIV